MLAKRCVKPHSDEQRSSAGTTALRRLRRGLHPKKPLAVSCAAVEAANPTVVAEYIAANRPLSIPAAARPL
eukprot:1642631-Pyramimonas_sp.AAC.1